jgi:hypothetical protein
VDSEEYFYMTGARELFDTFIDTGSNLCVELGRNIFGGARVFLVFPWLGFWRAWRVVLVYLKLRVCT